MISNNDFQQSNGAPWGFMHVRLTMCKLHLGLHELLGALQPEGTDTKSKPPTYNLSGQTQRVSQLFQPDRANTVLCMPPHWFLSSGQALCSGLTMRIVHRLLRIPDTEQLTCGAECLVS
jgi:hypothetical protein